MPTQIESKFVNEHKDECALVENDGAYRKDENGNITIRNKQEVHSEGLLHRAVSVFLFNKSGQILLQRRAQKKDHSQNLWSNTCCTHPRLIGVNEMESPPAAALRCLKEEMGITSCKIRPLLVVPYFVQVGNNIYEHEWDHIYIGEFDGDYVKNPDEVCEAEWMDVRQLTLALIASPLKYTPWLREIYGQVIVEATKKGFLNENPCQTIRKTCLVLASVDHIESIMKRIIIPALESKYEFNRVPFNNNGGQLPQEFDQMLAENDLVIMDITESNPYMIYELGRRMALGGTCVLLSRTSSINNIPDSIKRLIINYDFESKVQKKAITELQNKTNNLHSHPGLRLSNSKLIKQFGTTLVTECSVAERREYYIYARKIVAMDCKSIFLMQRSSTIILGPHKDWADETRFYNELVSRLRQRVDFYHIVNIEGIKLHYEKNRSDFPNVLSAWDELDNDGNGNVIINEKALMGQPVCGHRLKMIYAGTQDLNPSAERQARTLIAVTPEGTIGLWVLDLGGIETVLQIEGPKAESLLTQCINFYDRCPDLTWTELHRAIPIPHEVPNPDKAFEIEHLQI